ncbi:hypothetical protein RCL1_005860 [Eukaryota sp. TZLM3-RCL]
MPCSCVCHSKFTALHQSYENLKKRTTEQDHLIKSRESELLKIKSENIELQRSLLNTNEHLKNYQATSSELERFKQENARLHTELENANVLKLELDSLNIRINDQKRKREKDSTLTAKVATLLSENADLKFKEKEHLQKIQQLTDDVSVLEKIKLELKTQIFSLEEQVADLEAKYRTDLQSVYRQNELLESQRINDDKRLRHFKTELTATKSPPVQRDEPVDLVAEISDLKRKIASIQDSKAQTSRQYTPIEATPPRFLDQFDRRLVQIQSSIRSSKRSVENLPDFEVGFEPYLDVLDDFDFSDDDRTLRRSFSRTASAKRKGDSTIRKKRPWKP